MKRIFTLVLALILIFSLCACNNEQLPNDSDNQQQEVQGNQLLLDGDVINIDISSLPKGYNYSFSSKNAKEIIDYLSTLNLESDFEENPNEYTGMTWVISLEYDNGEALTIYHSANMFIRSENGPWYKMTFDEAKHFDTLLNELSNSDCIEPGIEPIKYTCDLTKFPTTEDCMGYGKILEITDGKLLVAPGAEQDRIEFGEVVWLICDEAEAYSTSQVVTYTFRDVKAPTKEGAPLNIIALLVYME